MEIIDSIALVDCSEDVALFVLHAALDGHVVAEHLPDRLAQGLRSVNHEQHPLLERRRRLGTFPGVGWAQRVKRLGL